MADRGRVHLFIHQLLGVILARRCLMVLKGPHTLKGDSHAGCGCFLVAVAGNPGWVCVTWDRDVKVLPRRSGIEAPKEFIGNFA